MVVNTFTSITFTPNSLLFTLYGLRQYGDDLSFGASREAMAINATMAAWHCVWPWMGGN